MRKVAVVLLGLSATVALSDDVIDVTDADKVAALTDIQDQVDSISAAVGECIAAGREHSVCLCESEDLILSFNNSVEQLQDNYPDLKTVDMVTFTMPSGLSVSQSLAGIRRQAQAKYSCN